jgi:predicted dehydrogenase
MANKIRVGIVGANQDANSWGARAHIPALNALGDYELKAICTAHEETAKSAAAHFGAELAFHDYKQMFAHPDIDLVAVAVRVPLHYEITMAALSARKSVYCEWPLGSNVGQAEEMADLARDKGVRAMVGLQARSSPGILYLRDLMQQRYVGDVVSVHMTLIREGVLSRPDGRTWQRDRSLGANPLTITAGHAIDALCYTCGEFDQVSAKIMTRVDKWRVQETGAYVDVTSPDHVLLNGLLDNGAPASVFVANVPYQNVDWRLEVYGRDGTIVALGDEQPNTSNTRILAAKGKEPLAELPTPDKYVLVPEGTPKGQSYNVAQAYARYADAVQSGSDGLDPDFDVAVRRHRLIAAMEHSDETGRVVKMQ